MAENKNEQAVLDQIENHTPEQLHPFLEAAFKNQKQILVGVVAVVALAAMYAGFTAYDNKARETAAARLGTVIIETSGDEKISQLEGLLNSAPSSAKGAVLIELAETCMREGKFDQAADYWGRLAADAEGNLEYVANMGKAKALTMGGKAGDAVSILTGLAASASAEFVIPVNRQLAVAAEQAGDKAAALAAYKVLSEKNVNDKPYVDYKITQLEAK